MKKTKQMEPEATIRCKGEPVIEPEIVGNAPRSSWDQEFHRYFGMPPFPLTAKKLETLVGRIDTVGPMQLGAFYPTRLRSECKLLLPRSVYGFDDWRFSDLLATWHRNFMFFKCRAIGEVLAHFEMMRQYYVAMR